MEINLNFKRVDVNAFTLKEAEEILAEKANFEKFANATQAWKNAGSPMQNTKEFKEFCANYLAEKTKNKQGLGCVIVYEAGKADTRERPWEMNDVVNELGKRKYKTTYLIIDEETGKILACIYTKEVVEGEKRAFTMKYQASKSAKEGYFIFFGIERN